MLVISTYLIVDYVYPENLIETIYRNIDEAG